MNAWKTVAIAATGMGAVRSKPRPKCRRMSTQSATLFRMKEKATTREVTDAVIEAIRGANA